MFLIIQTLLVAVAFLAAMVVFNRVITWLLLHTNTGKPNYSKMNPEEIVTIAHFSNHNEAVRCQCVVKSAGIRCMAFEEPRSQYKGAMLGIGSQLRVRAADAERALAILSGEN